MKETYTYTPVPKKKGALPVWFCFPCTYSIGMSALGYLHLFKLLDQNEDVHPERIFTDTEQTVHNPKTVELIGFSYSFELDFLNIFKILDKYGIPKRSSERGEEYPLIFGGGPVLTANPEPYADFFDFVLIGDGDEVFNQIISVLKNTAGMSKQQKLVALAEVEGLYVPSLFDVEYNENNSIKNVSTKFDLKKITRRCTELDNCVFTPIVTENTMFSNMFIIEMARGCPRRCRFCLASYLTLPARYPKTENIIKSIETGLEYSSKIGLLGASITEHPGFDDICSHILKMRKEKEFEISVASLRADCISPLTVQTLVACGQKNSTIAVEAGSDRLRKTINKNLSREQIQNTVKIARENGLIGLKIYGMIGLPTETQEDIEELITLMKELKTQNKGFKLTLSISSFVPKAQTPFQWAGREDNSAIQKKSDYLKKHLAINKIDFKPTSLKWDYIQGVLSRGDRRLSPLLEKVYEYNGSLGSWGRAYKEVGKKFSIPELDWYALRTITSEEILPWEHIDSGVRKDILANEYNKIM